MEMPVKNVLNPSPKRRNEGISLDLPWVRSFRIRKPQNTHRADAYARLGLPKGRKGVEPLMEVLRAVDLTTLSGGDTVARVIRLCKTARSPLPPPVRRGLGLHWQDNRVAAVCVFPAFVPFALEALDGTGISVATVSAGFPHGLSSLSLRIREVAAAVEAGAHEIDVVIRREWALLGRWEELYREVRAFREAARQAHLKVILGTGDLANLNQVARAALTSMMAGADFVKTSTGKEKVNATFPVGVAMARAIGAFLRETGFQVGLKPAGGIRSATEGFRWLRLVKGELGEEWSRPLLFRIGASGLVTDVVSALATRATS
jgi:deoxyribose-phosphate aldolase